MTDSQPPSSEANTPVEAPFTRLGNGLVSGLADGMAAIGGLVRYFIGYIGGLTRFSRDFLHAIRKGHIDWQEVIKQCERIGVRSMPIGILILLFVGMVFALQFGVTLKTMGAVPYVGKVTSLSIIRELGPVFTALVVGGRVGAGMAAELGSMLVTEQVDAMRALGADPIRKLLVPRVIATTLMLPLVALFADVVGVLGGMVISYFQFELSTVQYFESVVTTVRATDFAAGFFKPFFFGFGIALIGCFEGLHCDEGTVGVGKATTRTVVNISVMTVLVDFILTKLFTLLPRI